ncbi:MAG TPA: hypothetical protein VEN47_01175, partial [Myxococcota bacterium]|nr:hypothetical protein [Myxococcota bacterium]
MSESSSAPARGRHVWRWLSIAAAGLVAALLAWKLPQWQTDPWRGLLAPRDLLLVENARRQTVLLLFGVGLIAAALLLLWRHLAAREQAVRAAAAAADEAERSERFSAAIGQLADDRLEVRVGAIYGLEQLARESVERHWPIMEVLCAFVRTRAAWDPDRAPPARQPTDIQAVLTVLGRRRRLREQEGALDLQHTDLRGADLHGL